MAPSEAVVLNLLLLTLACFGAGAVGALLMGRWPRASRLVGHGCALLGAVGALALGATGLAGGTLSVMIPALSLSAGSPSAWIASARSLSW